MAVNPLAKIIFKLTGKIVFIIRHIPVKVLQIYGLTLGKDVFIGAGVVIDQSFPWLISIGDDVTLTAGTKILSHDASIGGYIGYTKVGKVNIGNHTFIGVNSIILPGVDIGDHCIIGAGSVVTKDVPPYSVVIGNPAKVVCSTLDIIEKHKKGMHKCPVFDGAWSIGSGITKDMREQMVEKLIECRGGYAR